jgi:hypothetical protein
MSAIQIVANDFGFGNDAIHWLASMKYWALRSEGKESVSYSRLRRHFMNEEAKAKEQQAYVEKKRAWADQWYSLTSKLLEIGKVLPDNSLREQLAELHLSETKKAALCIELSTFTAYHELKQDGKDWESLSFDDEDRKRFQGFCAQVVDESPYTLWMAWQEFNRCIEKIVKANSGPDLTWMWVGLGAAVLLVVAPYLAGAIGGFMGLGGAAATSAGLALLGGGSLAAGGFGMSGGYVVLMAGGAILGYGSGSAQYQQKLREGSKEELLFNCGKLYAASKVFNLYGDDKFNICSQALRIQSDLESESDLAFTQGSAEKGKQLDAKAMVMRSFRRLLRGELE